MNSTAISEISKNGNKYTETLGPFILTIDILEVIVGVVAILLNSLAIYILTAKLKLKQSDTIISFIVSLFDVIYSIFTIVHCSLLWITNHSVILATSYSQFVGYIYSCMGTCMIDSIALLSLIRFLAIYKRVQYSNKFWIILILTLITFNFMFGLIPLIQHQFKVQPSLKYSSVEFNLKNNWSINFYYCFIWIKLAIFTIIITVCYVFISIYYYNYLKNYNEEVEESQKLSKVNRRNLGGVRYEMGSIQLELDRNNNYQMRDKRGSAGRISSQITDESTISTVGQSDFNNNCTIDNLIRSTLSKLYIMLIVYTLEWVPFFLSQTLFKFLNIPISPTLDAVGYFLVHLIPIANPCFVLFFHYETYQELRFFIYLNYYKFFNQAY